MKRRQNFFSFVQKIMYTDFLMRYQFCTTNALKIKQHIFVSSYFQISSKSQVEIFNNIESYVENCLPEEL